MSVALPTLSLHNTAIAVATCVRAGRVPLVIGPPGIAKTALARQMAPAIAATLGYTPDQYPAVTCVLSNREAVDIGGFPCVLSDNTVEARLFGTLREAASHPCLLILDEFLTCSQSVQGPALRLVLERYAGEQPLHPDTRIVCVANPPDQAPGGIQMTAALVNRVVLLQCLPEVTEVSAFFCRQPNAALVAPTDLPDAATWQTRKDQLMVTAGVLFQTQPNLLCLVPPPAAISDGEPFGSPRAWEICCDAMAALPPGHLETVSDVCRAIVLGSVGPINGLGYLSTLRARHHLPTITEIIATPNITRVPDENQRVTGPGDAPGTTRLAGRDVIFAAIPLVLEAARLDTYAAWVYTARLPEEIQAALARYLMLNVNNGANSKWQVEGAQACTAAIKRFGGYQ